MTEKMPSDDLNQLITETFALEAQDAARGRAGARDTGFRIADQYYPWGGPSEIR